VDWGKFFVVSALMSMRNSRCLYCGLSHFPFPLATCHLSPGRTKSDEVDQFALPFALPPSPFPISKTLLSFTLLIACTSGVRTNAGNPG